MQFACWKCNEVIEVTGVSANATPAPTATPTCIAAATASSTTPANITSAPKIKLNGSAIKKPTTTAITSSLTLSSTLVASAPPPRPTTPRRSSIRCSKLELVSLPRTDVGVTGRGGVLIHTSDASITGWRRPCRSGWLASSSIWPRENCPGVQEAAWSSLNRYIRPGVRQGILKPVG